MDDVFSRVKALSQVFIDLLLEYRTIQTALKVDISSIDTYRLYFYPNSDIVTSVYSSDFCYDAHGVFRLLVYEIERIQAQKYEIVHKKVLVL